MPDERFFQRPRCGVEDERFRRHSSGGDQTLAIGGEGHRLHGTGESRELSRREGRTVRRRPKLHEFVVPRAGQSQPVGSDGDGTNGCAVIRGERRLAGCRVEAAHEPVGARRQNKLAVGTARETRHGLRHPGERQREAQLVSLQAARRICHHNHIRCGSVHDARQPGLDGEDLQQTPVHSRPRNRRVVGTARDESRSVGVEVQ